MTVASQSSQMAVMLSRRIMTAELGMDPECRTLIFLAAGFGFGHLGGHIAHAG